MREATAIFVPENASCVSTREIDARAAGYTRTSTPEASVVFFVTGSFTNGAPAIMYSSGNHIVSSKSYTTSFGVSRDDRGRSKVAHGSSMKAISMCWAILLAYFALPVVFSRRRRGGDDADACLGAR